MLRRALFVMCLGGVVAVEACGNSSFSSSSGESDGGIEDGSTTDVTVSDASPSDGAILGDGGTEDASIDAGPLPLISGQNNPHDLLEYNGQLFWTNYAENDAGGALMSANVDGTNVKTVAPGHHPNRLVGYQNNIFWTDFDNAIATGNNHAYQTPTGGGATSTIPGTLVAPMGIAADDHWVYIAELYKVGTNGMIIAISRDGFGPRFIAKDLDSPVSVAVDSSGITWSELGSQPNTGKIVSTDPDGGIIEEATNLQGVWDVKITTSNAFATGIGATDANGSGLIYRTLRAIDGGADTPFVGEGSRPYFITNDAGDICWTTEGDGPANGTVRCGGPFSSTAALTIASGQARPHGIAADATYVYWTSYSTGNIFRARKP